MLGGEPRSGLGVQTASADGVACAVVWRHPRRDAHPRHEPQPDCVCRKLGGEGVVPMSDGGSDLTQPGGLVRAPGGLGAGARAAWREAVASLGADEFLRCRTAAVRYVRAVDVADGLFAEWVRDDRPLVFMQPNRALGQHPLVVGWLAAARVAAGFGCELGLSPMAAARLGPRRSPGRPVGANSAPDRRSDPLPPLELVDGRPGPKMRRGEPPQVLARGARRGRASASGDARAVNRARGVMRWTNTQWRPEDGRGACACALG
jgi:hypothetical protein